MRAAFVRHRLVGPVAVLLTLMLLMPTASIALAGCGWPNCNPAQLSSTYSKSIAPSGVSGTIKVHQQSTVQYPGLETWTDFDGSSYAKWLGSTPWNASKITLTDALHTDGIAVSVSIPPGGSFSGSGSDATYTNSVSNSWQISHTFYNIHFSCLICYGVRHTATATFQFGTKFYTIQTHDDALV
jgi:hypothetical protein